MEKLSEGLEQMCVSDEDAAALIKPRFSEIIAALSMYIDEIERFNSAYGLVKVANREELIVKHILDSLAPLAYMPPFGRRVQGNLWYDAAKRGLYTARSSSVADAGSGAGLPGIPLAICLPGSRFTLIERMGRRAGFLRNVLAVLGLSNCQVEETEIEKAALSKPDIHGKPGAPDEHDGFDTICFRAFHPLTPELLKHLFRLLAPGGCLAAYKGRKDKTEAEMAAAGLERGDWQLVPLNVPFLDEERHLAIIPLPTQPGCDTLIV